jgi:DNA repair exonuclease SbcCD ATPase subunit
MILLVQDRFSIPIPGPSLKEMDAWLETARHAQVDVTSGLASKIGVMKALKDKYKQISGEVVEEASVPPELITQRINLQSRVGELNQGVADLKQQMHQRKSTESRLVDLQAQVQDLEELYKQSGQMAAELESLQAASRQGKLYDQLLSVGQEYLRDTQPEHCPLCKQTIVSVALLLEKLHEETPTDVNQLQQKYAKTQADLKKTQSRIGELERAGEEIQVLKGSLESIPANLTDRLTEKQEETDRLNTQIMTVSAEISQFEGRIKLSHEHHQRLDDVVGEITQVLREVPNRDIAIHLDEAIQLAKKQEGELKALDFDPIAKKIDHAKQLDQIREDEIRSRQIEAEQRTASQERTSLKYQIQKLMLLRDALLDIAETTKRRQDDIVLGALNALDLNYYYQQLDPHPVYRELHIEPELTGKGTYNYWLKAMTDDRSHITHVQTRFSTAQANAAAIALFLAVNQHLSRKLETIILDDPSQSMDLEHKKRLAQTLSASPRQVIVATEDPELYVLLADSFTTPRIHNLEI